MRVAVGVSGWRHRNRSRGIEEAKIPHRVVLPVERPEMQAGGGGRRRDQRIRDPQGVRSRIAREVVAGESPGACVEDDLAAELEERERGSLLTAPQACEHFGPRNRGRVDGNSAPAQFSKLRGDLFVPAQEPDHDVRVEENAGQPRRVRSRRVSLRRFLTYAEPSPISSLSRHSPEIPWSARSHSSCSGARNDRWIASRTRSETVLPCARASDRSRVCIASSRKSCVRIMAVYIHRSARPVQAPVIRRTIFAKPRTAPRCPRRAGTP